MNAFSPVNGIVCLVVLCVTVVPAWPGEAERFRLDGMVGQVNGEPVYARQVLEPVADQLATLGGQHGTDEFRARAWELVRGRLEQIVTDRLILAEARRDLTRRERRMLNHMIQERREELIRRFGRGSRALADRTLRERQGAGLEEALRDYRHELLVQRYMEQRILPQINVTRRDIARYYHENREEFQPDAGRSLRIIQARSPGAAEEVAQRLEAGEPFEQLATEEDLNRFSVSTGGLIDAPGEAPLAHEALNEALAELEHGRHTGPIEAGERMWFLYLEPREQEQGRTLREVQLEIEQELRARQFRRLSERYRLELFEQGSYASLDEMAERLLEIAVNRYARRGDT